MAPLAWQQALITMWGVPLLAHWLIPYPLTASKGAGGTQREVMLVSPRAFEAITQ